MDHDQDEPLPGLGAEPTARPVSVLERMVRRTIAALDDADLLVEVDALKLQLMIEIAETSTQMKARGKTSMIHNGWRLLWEIFESFTGKDAEVDEALAEAMRQWAEETGVPIPTGSSSP